MPAIPSVSLNDGATIPQFGLGVWQIPPAETAGAVRTALELGYRHVDTARMYANEAGVGQGIRDAGVPREEVWITTKLGGDAHGYDPAMRALDESLGRLDTDHVDLFLIHWPGAGDDVDTWRAFEKLRADGRARSIGVSNFSAEQIDRLVEATGVVPAVNQIRVNPRHPQRAMREYHQRHGIVTEAYGPLREGKIVEERKVGKIAERLGRTPAQVVLRWHLQHGFVVFPKTVRAERMRENIDIADFELAEADMAAIDALGRWR